jgi:hypothetical protein
MESAARRARWTRTRWHTVLVSGSIVWREIVVWILDERPKHSAIAGFVTTQPIIRSSLTISVGANEVALIMVRIGL